MNRRDFLKGAGAAAIVPAVLPATIWGSSAPSASTQPISGQRSSFPPITAVVYDERYADCKLFADVLVRHGAVAFPANTDAAQLWYGPLRAHLARHDGGVAGLTTYADFSVSKACGRELNFVTLFETSHDGRRSKSVLTHRLRVAGDERDIVAAFAGHDALWASALAAALYRVPAAAGDCSASLRSATVTTPRSSGHPGYLSSWLLAPRLIGSRIS